MNTPTPRERTRSLLRLLTRSALLAGLAVGFPAHAQTVPATAATDNDDEEEETLVLSPFVVDATQDTGYQATQTLAGTRIRTNLADVGSAISVLTKELITDIGGYNNQTVLAYAVNTEVAGPRGNFSGANRNGSEGHITESANFTNPNGNTRVRGLTNADNTRDFFLSSIPWDGYNISRVDLQRGPNAILFGLGSPAGIVNAATNPATFSNKGSFEATFDEFGTKRFALDYNRAVIPRVLGVRIALLSNDQKFQQKPAYRDDKRAYGALRFAPEKLNRNGMLFEVSGNFEHGEITANNPRMVPPEDQITMFWRPIEQGGVGGRTFNIFRDMFVEGDPVFAYDPVTYGEFGPGMTQYVNAGGLPEFSNLGVPSFGARDPQGNIIGGSQVPNPGPAWGNQISDMRALRPVQQWAATSTLPYAGVGAYRNEYITDTSIFDFYHKLLDGPNKEENNKWNAWTVDIQNTFFSNMLGYNLTMFREKMESDGWSALGWEGNAIRMDINEMLPNGGPNPNLGRAYVGARTGGGAWSNRSDREAYRAQLFAAYNFEKRHSGWWARALGEQRVTGVYSDEGQRTDSRSIRLGEWDLATRALFSPSGALNGPDTGGYGQMAFRYYLSPDLRSRQGATGLELPNLASPFMNRQGGTAPFTYFDTTWVAPASVNPGDVWVNPMDPTNIVHETYYQSNNPANYRGWRTGEGTWMTFRDTFTAPGTSMSARDYLTDSATLSESRVKSKVFVYQGTFWNHSIVGIYGWREDKARSYSFNTSFQNQFRNSDPLTGGANLSPGTYNFNNPQGDVGNLDTRTRNWSVMVHLNRLVPGRDYIPWVNIRLYYNEGENFRPEAGRNDMYGLPLPPPQGRTTDRSIMISTKDDKYTLRLTKYKTSITNATSTDAEIGNLWALQQTLGFGGPTNYFSAPPGIARGYQLGLIDPAGYASSGGDVNRLMTSIIPAWMQFEKDLRTQFPQFVNAWLGANSTFGTGTLTGEIPEANRPSGSVFTEDSVSSGYELELTANPTRNWRIAVNASKTRAVRTNVPGPSFTEVARFMENAIQNTDVGLMPIWWPQNVAGLRSVGPYPFFFRPEWLKVQALNGQSAGEIRRYRANIITNYTFDSGMLKGFGVGGGYRWEDRPVIGYAPIQNEDGTLSVNVNAPYYGPRETNLDMWLSYSRKIGRDLRWRIQLNVFNVGGKNDLVPIAAGVDPVRALALTNIGPNTVVPMKPTGFMIRQGMSWQLSNVIEF